MRVAPRAAPGEMQLAERGVADRADLGGAVADEGDRDAEVRHAAGEVGGAVDRVDHPGVAAGAAAGLLAEEGVVGEGLGDARA